MKYTIENEVLSVSAQTLGAELICVRAYGKERLWQNENGGWNGHAPVLFPVCGNCAMTVNGARYPLPPHGFASRKEFTLARKSSSELVFVLAADAKSRLLYPFEFEFTVTYSLQGDTLVIGYETYNPSNAVLPFSCGGHESFALEGPFSEYSIVFETKEHLLHRWHNERGLLTEKTYDFGERNEFALPEEFLSNGNTRIFSDLQSRRVTLCRNKRARAEINFFGFSNLLLWRPHGANMICIEPWLNLPDSVGADAIAFAEKAGVCNLPPRARQTFTRTIRYF